MHVADGGGEREHLPGAQVVCLAVQWAVVMRRIAFNCSLPPPRPASLCRLPLDVPEISDDCREEVYSFKITRNSNINGNIPLGEQECPLATGPHTRQGLQPPMASRLMAPAPGPPPLRLLACCAVGAAQRKPARWMLRSSAT